MAREIDSTVKSLHPYFSFCWKVQFLFRYSLLLPVFNGFFPCALIIFVKLELFVVENNYYLAAFPEMRIPARQDVSLQGVDFPSGTSYIIAMPSSNIPFIVNRHAIPTN